jgi:hypothetical protein
LIFRANSSAHGGRSLIEVHLMIKVDGQHDHHPFGRNVFAQELPKNIRRRSSCNPVIFVERSPRGFCLT